jgi:hypothetical protein
MRLHPGEIPLLSDAQYLEATLRILIQRKQKTNLPVHSDAPEGGA